jgi:hypothetical protein
MTDPHTSLARKTANCHCQDGFMHCLYCLHKLCEHLGCTYAGWSKWSYPFEQDHQKKNSKITAGVLRITSVYLSKLS